jgi:hypothetical protein
MYRDSKGDCWRPFTKRFGFAISYLAPRHIEEPLWTRGG